MWVCGTLKREEKIFHSHDKPRRQQIKNQIYTLLDQLIIQAEGYDDQKSSIDTGTIILEEETFLKAKQSQVKKMVRKKSD